jgi:hypothetical protein
MSKNAERSRHVHGSISEHNVLNKTLPATPEPVYGKN